MAEYNSNETNSLIPRTLAERRVDGECSGDYILPDTVADIKRILRVTAKIIPGGWYADGSRLEYEGRVVYSALVITEENKPVCLTYEEPFEDSVEIDGMSDGSAVSIRHEAGAVTWRMANQRKLGIRLKIQSYINVTEMQDTAPMLDGLSASELEYDRITLPAVCMYSSTESGRLSEDVEIEGTLPQFGEIIDCRCEMTVSECKCSAGNVQCRGEAMVSVLYLSDAGEPVFTVKHIPFMQPVGLDKAAENSQALAYAVCDSLSYEVKPNGYGEARVLALDFDYSVTAECAAVSNVSLLRDVYSTERAVKIGSSEITLTRLERGYITNFSVNAFAPRSEVGASDAERAIDADVRVSITGFGRDRERMKLLLEGNAEITVTALRKTEDGTAEYSGHTFNSPVKCELESGFVGGDVFEELKFRCIPSVTMVRTRMDRDNIYCDFEVAVALFAFHRETMTVVGSAEAAEADNDTDDGALILCYPNSDETLWDIAKRYRTTCTAVAEANMLGENERSPRSQLKKKHSVLLIPSASKRPSAELVISD